MIKTQVAMIVNKTNLDLMPFYLNNQLTTYEQIYS